MTSQKYLLFNSKVTYDERSLMTLVAMMAVLKIYTFVKVTMQNVTLVASHILPNTLKVNFMRLTEVLQINVGRLPELSSYVGSLPELSRYVWHVNPGVSGEM